MKRNDLSPSEALIAEVSALRAHAPTLNLGDRGVMLLNLAWLYQVIVASEPLMEEAISKAPEGALRKYLTQHIDEERGHAKWLEEDLASCGVSVKEVPLLRSAVELVGVQYYLINFVGPEAILGYMAVLEGFPFPLKDLELLEELHGKEMLRCLRYHAVNDLEHRKELFRAIDAVDSKLVHENAIRTQQLISGAFPQPESTQ